MSFYFLFNLILKLFIKEQYKRYQRNKYNFLDGYWYFFTIWLLYTIIKSTLIRQFLLESDVKYSMHKCNTSSYVDFRGMVDHKEQLCGKSAGSFRIDDVIVAVFVVIQVLFYGFQLVKHTGRKCHLLAAGRDIYAFQTEVLFAQAALTCTYRVNKRASISLKGLHILTFRNFSSKL